MCVILSCLISTGSLSPVDAQCAFRRYMIDAISSASSNLRRTWNSRLFQAVAISLRFSRSVQPIGFSFIQSFCAAIMQVIVASFADTRPNVTKSSNVYAAKIERVLMMDLTVGSLFMICDSMCVFFGSLISCGLPVPQYLTDFAFRICRVSTDMLFTCATSSGVRISRISHLLFQRCQSAYHTDAGSG
jgi:hypothetical protein